MRISTYLPIYVQVKYMGYAQMLCQDVLNMLCPSRLIVFTTPASDRMDQDVTAITDLLPST